METFIKSYDVKTWKVIKLGNLSLVSTNKDKDGKKNRNSKVSTDTILTLKDSTHEQKEITHNNSKAKIMLYHDISGKEYEKVSCCEINKEIWINQKGL